MMSNARQIYFTSIKNYKSPNIIITKNSKYV